MLSSLTHLAVARQLERAIEVCVMSNFANLDGQSDPLASADDSELLNLLTRMIEGGSPKRSVQPKPEPVPRCWPPLAHIDISDPTAIEDACVTFSRRHPALTLPCFQSIPARRVGRSPRSSTRGRQARLYCPKVERSLRAASDGEYFLILWRQIDAATSFFVEQPIYLKCRDQDGTLQEHRPDLFELRSQVPWFVESKLEEDASESEDRWRSIGTALSRLGFGYEVITQRHYERDPVYGNLRRIFLDRRCLPPWALIDSAVGAVTERARLASPCTIGELLALLPALGFRQVLALLFYNALSTDLDVEVSVDSPLFPPSSAACLNGVQRALMQPYSIGPDV